MSRATRAMRFSAPTIASSCAHFVFSFSRRSTSSPSVTSSNPASIVGFSVSSRASLARRLSVVDRHGRPVLDGPLDVVHADVVAEHGAGAGVGELDGRPGEADERRVGQRVPHVAGVAVDEVVLAAVRLVGDHHDVAAARQQRMPVARLVPARGSVLALLLSPARGSALALLLSPARGSALALPERGRVGEELLDRREHHAARFDGEFRPQVGAALGLDGRQPEQVGAAREGGEQLIVEIVAIRQHDDGGVFHRQVAHDATGVERHRQALARPLGVPDHADPAVAKGAGRLAARLVAAGRVAVGHRLLQRCRAQGLGDGGLHGVELVVPGHLLDQGAAAIVLEHDEVADQREQPAPVEDTFEQHLELRQARVGQRLARNRAPRLEPLLPGRQRADARFQSVRHDERGVEREQRRDLRLVGLKLLEGRRDGGVLVGGVLQLDDGERQSVHEQHDVRPPFVLVLDDGELVDGKPVVVVRVVEVERADLVAANTAVCVGVLHVEARDGHPMEVAVASLQRRPGRPGESAQGVVERIVGPVRIELGERGPQAAVQHDLAVVGAFRRRRVGWDVRAVEDGPAERRQPVEGDGFDGGLRDAGRRHGLQGSPVSCPSSRRTPSRCGFSNLHRWPVRSRSPASTTGARSR